MMQALNNDYGDVVQGNVCYRLCCFCFFRFLYVYIYYLSPLLFLPSFVRFTPFLFEVMRTLNIEKGKWTKVLNL